MMYMCFYIHTQAWMPYLQTGDKPIVIITLNTPRNPTGLICFVAAPLQVRTSKAVPGKTVAVAAI